MEWELDESVERELNGWEAPQKTPKRGSGDWEVKDDFR